MISIIIVNWNTGQQLADVISSINIHHTGLVTSVIAVDNASTDNSPELLDAPDGHLPFPLQIIRNKENRGFGAACNQGAALAEVESEYLLFLNPDTRLFEDSLSVPLAYMQQPENAKVGICGIQLIDEAGQVSRTCARFPSVGRFAASALGLSRLPWLQSWNHHMAEWDHATTREVDHVIGAFFLVRVDLFHMLNGFDERFFVYLEDLDFSYRAHQAGYRSVFLTDAQAYHAGGGTSRQVKVRRLFYSLRSRLLYGFKHFSGWRAWALVVVTICIEPVTRTAFSLFKGDWGGISNTQKAYGMLVANFNSILRRRY